MNTTHLTDKKFSDFDLDAALIRGLEEAGFEYCTPIQAETLPHALAGKDVAGQAQTGTGKTMAFLLATYQNLLSRPADPERTSSQPLALILAPTRELAIQIEKDADIIGCHSGLKLGLVYGGTGYDSQRRMLEDGVDILVGTPGRLIDYYKQGLYRLDKLSVLVLDEADRMFDMGFIKDIRYLLHRMTPPDKRLSMLFSATLSHRVEELAYEHMNEPIEVKIETDSVTADKVTQLLYHPSNEEKLPLLVGLLQQHAPRRSLVFVNTKWAAEKVYASLLGNGFSVGIISGDVPQKKRERLLQAFKDNEIHILVATDVAARGLHIPDVSHVFNYDLPQDAEDYVHRIGRTARAGASGDAISFACEDTAYNLMDIEEYIGKAIPAARVEPDILAHDMKPPARIERHRPGGRERPASGQGDARGRGPRRKATAREAAQPADQSQQRKPPQQARQEPEQVETPLSPSAGEAPTVRRSKHETPAIG